MRCISRNPVTHVSPVLVVGQMTITAWRRVLPMCDGQFGKVTKRNRQRDRQRRNTPARPALEKNAEITGAKERNGHRDGDLLQVRTQRGYQPPLRGAPTRRVGGATRGAGDEDIFVTVLAPRATGLTNRESPTLYWFVSRAPARQVEFVLIRHDRIQPVAELALSRPASGGIAKISLAEIGVKLEPGVTYEWSIALVKDRQNRSSDIITSGTLVRKTPDGALENLLKNADTEAKFALYGKAGYWYDAIELASKAISSGSVQKTWRGHRASFLEQVGLETVAAYDRST